MRDVDLHENNVTLLCDRQVGDNKHNMSRAGFEQNNWEIAWI
jgi:hypothetical protein